MSIVASDSQAVGSHVDRRPQRRISGQRRSRRATGRHPRDEPVARPPWRSAAPAGGRTRGSCRPRWRRGRASSSVPSRPQCSGSSSPQPGTGRAPARSAASCTSRPYFDVRRAAPEHSQSRRGLRRDAAHPEVRANARRVGQRHERVVVDDDPGATPIELRVDRRRRTKEHERLIDQVAAQIVEEPARLGRRAVLPPGAPRLGPPSLEPRLEAVHVSERSRRR